MSRIRYLKPSFFKNEDLADLPLAGRLFFAGLWTQADRSGRLEDRPRRLKAELFPYDNDIDIEGLLQGLVAAGFVRRYTVGGRRLLDVPTLPRHQRFRHDEPESTLPAWEQRDHPEATDRTAGESSDGTTADDSDGTAAGTAADDSDGTAAGTAADDSDGTATANCDGTAAGAGEVPAERIGKGIERGIGKGRGRDTRVAGADAPATTGADAPGARPQALLNLWNTTTTPPIPRAKGLTPARRRLAAARLRERPLTEWAAVFARVNESDFCRGNGDRGWKATIDWLLRPGIAQRVLEGAFDNPGPRLSARERRQADEAARLQAWLDRDRDAETEVPPARRRDHPTAKGAS